jgi:hypothetical protein
MIDELLVMGSMPNNCCSWILPQLLEGKKRTMELIFVRQVQSMSYFRAACIDQIILVNLRTLIWLRRRFWGDLKIPVMPSRPSPRNTSGPK